MTILHSQCNVGYYLLYIYAEALEQGCQTGDPWASERSNAARHMIFKKETMLLLPLPHMLHKCPAVALSAQVWNAVTDGLINNLFN